MVLVALRLIGIGLRARVAVHLEGFDRKANPCVAHVKRRTPVVLVDLVHHRQHEPPGARFRALANVLTEQVIGHEVQVLIHWTGGLLSARLVRILCLPPYTLLVVLPSHWRVWVVRSVFEHVIALKVLPDVGSYVFVARAVCNEGAVRRRVPEVAPRGLHLNKPGNWELFQIFAHMIKIFLNISVRLQMYSSVQRTVLFMHCAN